MIFYVVSEAVRPDPGAIRQHCRAIALATQSALRVPTVLFPAQTLTKMRNDAGSFFGIPRRIHESSDVRPGLALSRLTAGLSGYIHRPWPEPLTTITSRICIGVRR